MRWQRRKLVNRNIRVGKYFFNLLEKYKEDLKNTPFEGVSTPLATDLWAREYLDYKCGVKRGKKRKG